MGGSDVVVVVVVNDDVGVVASGREVVGALEESLLVPSPEHAAAVTAAALARNIRLEIGVMVVSLLSQRLVMERAPVLP